MYKRVLFGLLAFALITVLFAACAIKDEATLNQGGTQVKMGASNFIDTSVTIKKGDSIKLVDTVSSLHTITNGTWQGSTPKPETESGAPKVNINISNAGQSATVGPFSQAGTFNLYCTIHQGMNLKITVQ